jgi:transposase-like protein
LLFLLNVRRIHVAIWKWIQKGHSRSTSSKKRRKIDGFIVDETLLKVVSEYTWLWVAIDAKSKEILALLLLINLRRETCLLRNGFCQT